MTAGGFGVPIRERDSSVNLPQTINTQGSDAHSISDQYLKTDQTQKRMRKKRNHRHHSKHSNVSINDGDPLRPEQDIKLASNQIRSVCGRYIYHISIIDYL